MPTQVAETSYGCSTFAMVVLALLLVVAAITIPIFWKRDTVTTCDHRVAAAKAEEGMKNEEIKNELKLQVRKLEMQTTKLETEKEQLANEKITLTVKNENLESDLKKKSASLSAMEGEKKRLELENNKLEAENTQFKKEVSQIDSQINELLIEKREEKMKSNTKESESEKLRDEKVTLQLQLTEKTTLVDHLKDNKHHCELEKKELETKNTHLFEGKSELNIKLATTQEKLEVAEEKAENYGRIIDTKWIEQQSIGHARDGKTIELLSSEIEQHKHALVLAKNAALADDNECKGTICQLIKSATDTFFS